VESDTGVVGASVFFRASYRPDPIVRAGMDSCFILTRDKGNLVL
jgi:hypothetical protein